MPKSAATRSVRLTEEHLRILDLAKDKLRDVENDSDVFRWMLEEWRDRQDARSKDAKLDRILHQLNIIMRRLHVEHVEDTSIVICEDEFTRK